MISTRTTPVPSYLTPATQLQPTMGCCASTAATAPPPHPASLSVVELNAYEPSSPFVLSIPDAITQFHSTFPPCTLASLQQQRDEYWDTRVEGDQAVWLILRRVCECGEGDGMRDVMLESSGLQQWSIDKPDGVFTYDVKGARYDVPFFCLYQPHTLITAEQEAASKNSTNSHLASTPSDSHRSISHSANQPPPIDGSGAVSADTDKAIKFKVRFSDGSFADLPLALSPSTPLAIIRALVKERVGLVEERQVFFLHGKRLVSGTVAELGLEKGMVLQCFVKQQLS